MKDPTPNLLKAGLPCPNRNVSAHARTGRSPSREILAALSLAVLASLNLSAQQKFTPEDLGQTVNGYQDDFSGAARNPDWVPVPAELDFYEQANGVLRVTVVGEALDTHLLYQAPGYSDTVQEVLARIRVTAFGIGDAPRCGVAVAVNAENSQGINLHFRDHNQDGLMGRQFKLLDDRRAWGPRGLDLKWEDNTWYWLRLRQTGPGTAGGNNLNAKVWLADGTVPEPSDWQMNWRRSGRTGFAGLVGSSIGGLSEFDVDYILIKAEGLPSIKVASSEFPEPFFLSLRQHPASATSDVGQTATFTVAAAASATAAYQWQRASGGSTNFTNIAGATSSTYTTPPLTRLDHAAKFRCVVSIPGASVTSREATLTVDVVPPAIDKALASVNLVLDGVTIVFTEPIQASTATNLANYSIPGVDITSVRLSAGGTNAVLKTSPLTPGASYVVSVKDVQDLAGNRIAPGANAPVSLSLQVPADFGKPVAGFQDDFSGTSRNPDWLPVPPEKDNYEQAGGILRVTVVGDNPGLDTHLLYARPGYSEDAQEVLARIRIVNFGVGDAPRGGVAVGVNLDSSQGINLHFRDNDQDGIVGRQFKLLDDRRAWGPPGLDLDWENQSWYWLRLRQLSSIVTDGPNIHAKVWLADGTEVEPADWQMSWTRADRFGFAGIVGSSIGGLAEYDVDYILIKAEGLPEIRPGSSTFPAAPPATTVKLEVTRTGNNATVAWSGGGALEAADQISGPWAVIAGASSPHPISFTSAAKFYRVRR